MKITRRRLEILRSVADGATMRYVCLGGRFWLKGRSIQNKMGREMIIDGLLDPVERDSISCIYRVSKKGMEIIGRDTP